MRTITTFSLVAAMLSGCANSMPGIPGMGARASVQMPQETYAYHPAADAHLRVEVQSVSTFRDQGYIPSDPNWLQIRLRITNVGSQTAGLTRAGERLTDGTVLNAAQSGHELIRPPSMVREMAMNTGLGIGTMAAGALLFPPAAIIGGALMAFRPMFAADQVGRIGERINQEGLRVGPIAPGTAVQGLVFFPAVTGQDGLVLFYEVNGQDRSIVIDRAID